MAATARVVENVGVGAYLGAATLISDPVLLTAAGSILTTEARHQSILNVLNGGTAIPSPFDIALAPPEVLALAGPFISGCDLGVKGSRLMVPLLSYLVLTQYQQPTHPSASPTRAPPVREPS